jgi:hypothetical protein
LKFVRRNHARLAAGQPVWLFSSRPLGIETTDADGRDVRAGAEPAEIAEFIPATTGSSSARWRRANSGSRLGFRPGRPPVRVP